MELLIPRQMQGPKIKLRKRGWKELERQKQSRYVHRGRMSYRPIVTREVRGTNYHAWGTN